MNQIVRNRKQLEGPCALEHAQIHLMTSGDNDMTASLALSSYNTVASL